jgi:hypothetical protein
MSFFADLTPHTYTKRETEEGVLNIGWLGAGNPIPTGDAPAVFVEVLALLCSRPTRLHRGFHTCEFCRKERGNGQIRVCNAGGLWYCAPAMVHHYVTVHRYLPPAAFIEAVLHPARVAE